MGAAQQAVEPFTSCWGATCSLGRREAVEEAAVTQRMGDHAALAASLTPKDSVDLDLKSSKDEGTMVSVEPSEISSLLEGTTYTAAPKDTLAGRALDEVVQLAGSRVAFGGILAIITGWAIAGGVLGGPDLWQIILQDTSSIQCYISDMILMRQQMNDFREHLRMVAILRSRAQAVAACFDLLLAQGRLQAAAGELARTSTVDLARLSTRLSSARSSRGNGRIALGLERVNHALFHGIEAEAQALDLVGDGTALQPQGLIDRTIVYIADVMGSIWMLLAFCIGMISWIALGPKYDFSNNWQLWLNTCLALQQTLSTCLLTLARNRHTAFVERCMCAILREDCEVEYRARALSGHRAMNPPVRIEWAADSRFSRAMDWYASLIGSGYGAAVSALLFIGWIAVGNVMSWGDNWWLIVGTWTGVVGTFNAAVLRYSLFQEETKSKAEYGRLIAEDKAIFSRMGLRATEQTDFFVSTVMTRISLFTSRVCASPWAVGGTLALIAGLLVGATVVLWNETAQLLVNSVTMIVESFFLIVLIDAHNVQAVEHRVRLHDMLLRRLQLLVILRRVGAEVDTREAAEDGDQKPDERAPLEADAPDVERVTLKADAPAVGPADPMERAPPSAAVAPSPFSIDAP